MLIGGRSGENTCSRISKGPERITIRDSPGFPLTNVECFSIHSLFCFSPSAMMVFNFLLTDCFFVLSFCMLIQLL